MAFPYLEDLIEYLTGIRIPLPIPTFGFFSALALLVAGLVQKMEFARFERSGILFSSKKPDFQLSQNVIDIFFYTCVSSAVGAKLLHVIEHSEELNVDPLGMIFSTSGFSFLGAFLAGFLAVIIYLRQKGLPLLPVLDAVAPSLMLGYAIGRLGCHFSGDGDWGVMADMSLKPDWLPKWLWASQFKGNIINVQIPGPGVYPTSLYESLMAVLIFVILWMLRKHPFQTGWLFSVYLIFAGFERMIIEEIRVNVKYQILGLEPSQSQIISLILMLMGMAGVIYFSRKKIFSAGIQ